jgi:hypothetical protein
MKYWNAKALGRAIEIELISAARQRAAAASALRFAKRKSGRVAAAILAGNVGRRWMRRISPITGDEFGRWAKRRRAPVASTSFANRKR